MNLRQKIKSYDMEIVFCIFLFILMAISPSNHSIKGIIKILIIPTMFTIFFIGLKKIYNSIEDRLIYLLGLLLPFTTILLEIKNPNVALLAGASPHIMVTLYDSLIIFLVFLFIKNKKLKIKNKKVFIIPLVYVIINFISIFFSMNKGYSIIEFIRIVKIFALFVYIVENFTKRKIYIFLNGLAIATLAQLLIGLLQIIKQGPVGLQFLGEAKNVFRVSVKGLEKGLSGTLKHPGTLALFSLFSLNIFLYLKKSQIKLKNIVIGASILTIILSFSRTITLLMFGSLVLYGIYQFLGMKREISLMNQIKSFIKKVNKYLLISITIIVLIVSSFVVKRFINSDLAHQLYSRANHTEIALTIREKNGNKPVGANNYTVASKKTFPMEYSKGKFRYVQPVHNLYVLYLVEIGVIGAIVYLIMNLTIIFRFMKSKFTVDKEFHRILAGVTAWTIVLTMYNLTGWSGAKDQMVIITWISMAFSYIAYKGLKENSIENEQKESQNNTM